MSEIRKLSPAAARLLLAFLSAGANETYDEVAVRSGIRSLDVLVRAKKTLAEHGFLLYDVQGREHLSFQRSDVQ